MGWRGGRTKDWRKNIMVDEIGDEREHWFGPFLMNQVMDARSLSPHVSSRRPTTKPWLQQQGRYWVSITGRWEDDTCPTMLIEINPPSWDSL